MKVANCIDCGIQIKPWAKRCKPHASKCGSENKVEWANISHKYLNVDDFIELCHRHHAQFDRGIISL